MRFWGESAERRKNIKRTSRLHPQVKPGAKYKRPQGGRSSGNPDTSIGAKYYNEMAGPPITTFEGRQDPPYEIARRRAGDG